MVSENVNYLGVVGSNLRGIRSNRKLQSQTDGVLGF